MIVQTKKMIAAVALTLASASVFATKYTWKTDVLTGNWCDEANWTTDDGTTGYPNGSSAQATMPKRGGYEIDLQGQTIQLSTTKYMNVFDGGTVYTPATYRNGKIKAGIVFTQKNSDVVFDSVAFTDNYLEMWENSHVVFTGTSPAENKELVVKGGGVLCEIKGVAKSGRGQFAGTSASPSVLSIDGGSLTFSSTLANVGNCVLRFLNGGTLTANKFRMNGPAAIEVGLRAADAGTPCLTTPTFETPNDLTIRVLSAEKPGKYELIRAGNGFGLGKEDLLKKFTLDISALGRTWSGTVNVSDDGTTVWIWLHKAGLNVSIR